VGVRITGSQKINSHDQLFAVGASLGPVAYPAKAALLRDTDGGGPGYAIGLMSIDIYTIPEIIGMEEPQDLARSEAALVQRWEAGFRDEETALRLAFIEWWACCEPRFLTGLENGSESTSTKPSHFDAIYDEVMSTDAVSLKALFVLGWMTVMFPYCCGPNNRHWDKTGGELLKRFDAGARQETIVFDQSSTYGQYFAQMLAKR
jgi:hypothetical protein